MISLLVLLAVIGLAAYLLTAFLPLPAPVKTVIVIVAVLAICLIAWNAFGRPGDVAVPRL